MKFLISFAFICALTSPFVAFAQNNSDDKISQELYPLFETANKVDCIIQFTQKADLSQAQFKKTKAEKGSYVVKQLLQTRGQSQENVLKYLDSEKVAYNSFYLVNALSTTLTFEQVVAISEMFEVKSIAYNPTVRLEKYQKENTNTLKALPEPEWGVKKIQADSVWSLGYRGEGVVIGGQDTGYEWTHPALKLKYRGSQADTVDHNYNWHDAIHKHNPANADSINPCGYNLLEPCDDNNHGTHTMGTMIGSDSLNAIGVAPNAQWIACRNMERGVGQPSTYIECFEWFLAPTDLSNGMADPSLAPDVINNSWTCPENEGCNSTNWELMEEAIINLKLAGIVVIVSAGNEGNKGCATVDRPPASFASAFAIGATQINDSIAPFSSKGPVLIDSSFRLKPDVSAPGYEVRSSIRNGEYRNFSGTSMAGPHVVGAVALIINANPSLRGRVNIIENILINSTEMKIDSSVCFQFDGLDVPNHVYGHGIINALKAVELAQVVSSVQEVEILNNVTFELFPNPAFDIININPINMKESNYSISIYDISGRLMLHQTKNPQLIKIENLTNGIYFVQLKSKAGNFTKKLVVGK